MVSEITGQLLDYELKVRKLISDIKSTMGYEPSGLRDELKYIKEESLLWKLTERNS